MRQLVGDFVKESLNVDGKIWRTLQLLLFKPGQLSAEYVGGRRTRYLKPVTLYLCLGAFYFFVAQALRPQVQPERQSGSALRWAKETQQRMLEDAEADLTHAEKELAEAVRLRDERVAINGGEQTVDAQERVEESQTVVGVKRAGVEFHRRMVNASTSFGRLEGRARQAVYEWLPRLYFLLLPWLAVLQWLFFRRARAYFAEVFVFTTHIYSFGFLAGGIGAVFRTAVSTSIVLGAMAVYWTIASRRFFGGSLLATLGRGVGVALGYSLPYGVLVIVIADHALNLG